MSKPLVVSIPHSLGRQEAVQRIKDGAQFARDKYASLLSISREEWTGDDLSFRVGVLGQSAEGTIAITDTDATVTVLLPWLLAKFAEKAQVLVQQQGRLLLEKK